MRAKEEGGDQVTHLHRDFAPRTTGAQVTSNGEPKRVGESEQIEVDRESLSIIDSDQDNDAVR